NGGACVWIFVTTSILDCSRPLLDILGCGLVDAGAAIKWQRGVPVVLPVLPYYRRQHRNSVWKQDPGTENSCSSATDSFVSGFHDGLRRPLLCSSRGVEQGRFAGVRHIADCGKGHRQGAHGLRKPATAAGGEGPH